MSSIYVVMPAYNEEANIEATVKDWYSIVAKGADSRLVIADSGSTDSTHKILLALKKKYPKIEILSKTGQYHGPKVIALYKYAIKKKADWVFQTDSDGQTNPAEFKAFWEARTKYDAIIGNRSERGDGKDRAFVERVVCRLLKFYFGVKVPDANAPFRLMKASLVAKYVNRLDDDYDLPNIMMTTFFAYYGENVAFREISFKPRGAGKNSINIKKIVKIGWNALGDFRKFKKEMKKDEGKTA